MSLLRSSLSRRCLQLLRSAAKPVRPTLRRCCFAQQRAFHSSPRWASEDEPRTFTGPESVKNVPPKVQKIVDDIAQLNMLESAQLVNSLKSLFGITDEMMAPAAVAVAGAAAAVEEGEEEKEPEKTIFRVELKSFDPKGKIKIIKEVRNMTKMGLKQTKELVEGAPCIIKEDVNKEEGQKIIDKIKEFGGECEMV